MKTHLLILIGLLSSALSFAQASAYSVELEAALISNPPGVLLSWETDANATDYIIYRKLAGTNAWGTPLVTLGGSNDQYFDQSLSQGDAYEYKVQRNTNAQTAFGYVESGLALALGFDRGGLLLLIEDTLAAHLTSEIEALKADLLADGWRIQSHTVSKDTTHTYVHSLIQSAYQQQNNLNTVYIIGHVPVPYSGELAPDGHVPDHLGAWPADVYYGDMNGAWTDVTVNNTGASDPRNDNVPGDGKFDQSTLPSDLELTVSRIDFSGLTFFSDDEIELTKSYLQRVHDYKHGVWSLPHRALIDDNFGAFGGEAFSVSGWRNFSALVGRDSINSADYRTTLANEGYLWSYGCGGGSHTSAGGIGTSLQLSTDSLMTGFTMLFGSYFGDWDRQNNFLRSALAQGRTMSISWAGRPQWFYHPMAMGRTIGYCARLTQNNGGHYESALNYGARFVHVAQLGDPSLRMSYPSPAASFVADALDSFHVALNWGASSDADAYLLLRSMASSPPDTVAVLASTSLSYIDSCLIDSGHYAYTLLALREDSNASGAFLNHSLAKFDTVAFTTNRAAVIESAEYSVNPGGSIAFKFWIEGKNYTNVLWIFPEEDTSFSTLDTLVFNSSIEFNTAANFSVVVSNACSSDTLNGTYLWESFGVEESTISTFDLYPNPVRQGGSISIRTLQQKPQRITIYDVTGKRVCTKLNADYFETTGMAAGAYWIQIESEDAFEMLRFMVIND